MLTLIGYRGTGKTTVARLLAARLGTDWWDSDSEIERRDGRSVRRIFAEMGEDGFRGIEERVIAELAELAAERRGVLAVGGGAVLRAANRRAIARGKVVWLTASPRAIWDRVTADPSSEDRRPNLTTAGGLAEIETVLAAREELYRQCADYPIATDAKTPEQVAAEIVCLVPELSPS